MKRFPISIGVHSGRLVCVGAAILCSAAGVSHGANFTDTSKINVLRQFNLSMTNQVTSSVSIVNAGSIGLDTKTADGSARPSGAGGWGETSSWTETFILPGPRTVASYHIDWNAAGNTPGTFKIEGKRASDGVFVELVNQAAAAHSAGSFSSTETVTQIRYTATGGAVTTMLTTELSVFMAPGQTVPLQSGFNFLADPGVLPTGVANRKVSTLVGGTQWKGWSGDPAGTSTNNTFDNGDAFRVISDGNNNQRGYIAYSFTAPTYLNMMSIGMFNNQTFQNWEVYTTNASLVAGLDSLAAATPAALQAAGWVLQHQQVGAVPVGGTGSFIFTLPNPGPWQHLLLVKSEADDGNPVEFEAFAVPEPASAGLLTLGVLALLRRRR